MTNYVTKERYSADDLIEITKYLRDPEAGCPWDKEQTHQSIRKNFLEETCEVLEAIDANDAALLREELGDVLMQIALHACMEEECGNFTFEDICTEVCKKLIYRHPHVFSQEKVDYDGLNGWEALKNKEKGRQTLADELQTVPITLPALMRVQKLQKRAAKHDATVQTLAQANEQAQQAQQAFALFAGRAQETSMQASADEATQLAGNLLFTTANQLRLLGVDAEEALSLAIRQFTQDALEADRLK